MMLDQCDLPIELEAPRGVERRAAADERTNPVGAIGALLAAAGLIITVMALNGLGDEGRRYESYGDGRLRPYEEPDPSLFGDGPTAPTVAVDVNDDLVDAQVLTVTGTGFAPGAAVALTQCVLGLVEPVSNCYQSTSVDRVTADDNGEFTTPVAAHRFLASDSGVLDCAHLTAGRCAVVVIADRAASPQATRFAGAVQLRYDREPVRPPETVVATQTPGVPARAPDFEIILEDRHELRDGDRVTVLISGAEPGLELSFELCGPATPASVECQPVAEHQLGDSERAWFDIRLPRLTRDWETSALVDCASGCDLRVRTADSQTDIAVSFDPDRDLLPPAVLTFDDATTVPGQHVTVNGSGFLPLTSADSFICSRPIDRDEEFWADPVNWCGWPANGLWTSELNIRDNGTFEATFVHPRSIDLFGWTGPHNCDLQDCWLVVTTGRVPGTTPVASIRLGGETLPASPTG